MFWTKRFQYRIALLGVERRREAIYEKIRLAMEAVRSYQRPVWVAM